MICDRCGSLKKHMFNCDGTSESQKLDCAMGVIWYEYVMDKADLEGYKRKFTTKEEEIIKATLRTVEKELRKRLLKEK